MESGKNFKNTFRKEVKATEWAFDRILEAFEQVAKDEAKKLSIVKEIMIRSTDYLRRIITPAGGARRRHDIIFVPALKQFPVGRLRLVRLLEKRA